MLHTWVYHRGYERRRVHTWVYHRGYEEGEWYTPGYTTVGGVYTGLSLSGVYPSSKVGILCYAPWWVFLTVVHPGGYTPLPFVTTVGIPLPLCHNGLFPPAQCVPWWVSLLLSVHHGGYSLFVTTVGIPSCHNGGYSLLPTVPHGGYSLLPTVPHGGCC